MLPLEALEPAELLGAPQFWLGLLCQRQIVRSVNVLRGLYLPG